MFRFVPLLRATLSLCFVNLAAAADNGDGTYTNPPLYADYPDPDIIRVDDHYYMVSTTFVNSPGLAVLHSKDLVDCTFSPTSQAVVEMDISNLRVGDTAGLGMLGKGLATLAVERHAGGDTQLARSTGTATADARPVSEQATASLGAADTVYFTLRMDFGQEQGHTAYSLDGLNWTSIGESFPLLWDWATGAFQGEQYAVFNYNAGQSGGFVDVDRVSFVQRSDFDLDGDLDADDYLRLRSHQLAPLDGASPLETFAFGDVDGDLDNDYEDFRYVKGDYIGAHGEAALDALIAEVGDIPEPDTSALTLLGMMTLAPGSGRPLGLRSRCVG